MLNIGIKKKRKKNKIIRILSAFFIIIFIYLGLGFCSGETGLVENTKEITHFILSFLSRGWVILANLAGKMMSNDLIYGSIIHLDTFLRKTRNIMKNFANYTLGFLFLYMIIQSIIKRDGGNDIIKKKLVGFVAAGILIQASRFLLGAVIDISTITVTAIGAIPGQILQSDIGLQKNLLYLSTESGIPVQSTGQITTGIKLTFHPNKAAGEPFITQENYTLDEAISQENYIDMILPSYNSISGPLIFLGTSIFQFQNFPISNPETTKGWKFILEFSLNLLIIAAYTLAMFILFIINIFRIFFLRIVIIFSPFIVLLGIMGKMGIMKADSIGIMKSVSISNVVNMIFKPVIFVGYLSIMMIFIIGVRSVLIPMNNSQVNINDEVTMISQQSETQADGAKSYNSSIKSNGIFNFSVNGAKSTIADIIVYFITLFLLRFLIKAAIASPKSSGIPFLDKQLGNLTKKVEGFAGDIPIVPIGEGVGVNQVFGKDSNSLVSKMKENSFINKMGKESQEKLEKEFPELYNKNDSTDYDLEKAAKSSNPEEFRNTAKSHAVSEGGIKYESSSERRNSINTRFETNKKEKPQGRNRNNINSLDEFLNNKGNLESIHTKMGGTGTPPSKIDDFQKQEYGKTTTPPPASPSSST